MSPKNATTTCEQHVRAGFPFTLSAKNLAIEIWLCRERGEHELFCPYSAIGGHLMRVNSVGVVTELLCSELEGVAAGLPGIISAANDAVQSQNPQMLPTSRFSLIWDACGEASELLDALEEHLGSAAARIPNSRLQRCDVPQVRSDLHLVSTALSGIQAASRSVSCEWAQKYCKDLGMCQARIVEAIGSLRSTQRLIVEHLNYFRRKLSAMEFEGGMSICTPPTSANLENWLASVLKAAEENCKSWLRPPTRHHGKPAAGPRPRHQT